MYDQYLIIMEPHQIIIDAESFEDAKIRANSFLFGLLSTAANVYIIKLRRV